jgi:transcriptional regulator of acetoin/glycerol metabolism
VLFFLSACAPRRAGPKEHIVCSFCDGDDAPKMIAGPTIFICSRCADVCNRLLSRAGDSRVVEFAPMPVVDGTSKPDCNADEDTLSEEARARLRDGLEGEIRRRYDALSMAMHVAHGSHNPVITEDNEDATQRFDVESLLPIASRTRAEYFARTPWPLLITGDSVLRQGAVARRIHEMSDRAGECFIRIDCRVPGALAHIHDAGKGTLFLEEVGALTPQAQEFLEIVLHSGAVPALESRVICGGSAELESSIARAEFSEILAMSLTHLRL